MQNGAILDKTYWYMCLDIIYIHKKREINVGHFETYIWTEMYSI